jgi:ankyrin repeat protein
MFPNPQDALPLPVRPGIEQYKKLAKDLVKAATSPDAQALNRWTQRWIESLVRLSNLTITPHLPVSIGHWIDGLETFVRRQKESGKRFSATRAQFVIARAHGFESWPKFAKHLQALAQANSSESEFENAAAAIVTGDLSVLERLLRNDPKLIRQHSSREHRATLLHYVAANGVEGYRQKTPSNAAEIAAFLLKAGADVNATADVYGGPTTTLELVATSLHTEQAGVQEQLMELLLQHGASLNSIHSGHLVTDCLANGRVRAADFLVDHGAPLDLEGAAGLGRLETVKTFFDSDGHLRSNATPTHMERGFLWACEYGRNEVIEFFLQRGAALDAEANTGQSALHWAVIGGRIETIKLLISRGADLQKRNRYGSTPLGQALWSAVHSTKETQAIYLGVIEALIEAGATIEEEMLPWLLKQKEVPPNLKRQITNLLKKEEET